MSGWPLSNLSLCFYNMSLHCIVLIIVQLVGGAVLGSCACVCNIHILYILLIIIYSSLLVGIKPFD